MWFKQSAYAGSCIIILLISLSCVTPPRAIEEDGNGSCISAERTEDFHSGLRKKTLEDRIIPDEWGEVLLEQAVEKRAVSLLAGMSLSEKIGQLFFISLWNSDKSVYAGKVDEWVTERLRTVKPGGIILFGGNIGTEEQTLKLTRDLQETSRIPLFIATDQEGGYVSRLTESKKIDATSIPSPKELGKLHDTGLTSLAGWVIGRELASLGINMDFAPLADVLTNEGNTIIGTRSFGSDFETVADHSSAFARGLKAAGVVAVIKHFPGHGSSKGDPHKGSVSVEETLETLRNTTFLPFRRGVEEGIDCVMTAHISLPGITGTDYPASCSRYINLSLLRGELGFGGLIITDSLAMGAISERWESGEGVMRAFTAGADLLLMPKSPEDAYAALAGAVAEGRIEEVRIDQSVKRILEVKIRRGIIPLDAGPVASRKLAQNLRTSKEQVRERVEKYFPETRMNDLPGKIVGNKLHKKIAGLLRDKIAEAVSKDDASAHAE